MSKKLTKKTQPDISFIMPCFKDARTLPIAVNSILDQDLKNLEVIIVNDGDKDAKKVIEGLQKKDSRVQAIHFEKNRGACVARNSGARLARGRYLSFLPADAFLYPGNARVWVETLDAHPEYDFLYGGYRFVKEGTLSPHGGEAVFDYQSEPFDPYFLDTKNYIDGSFPMRREVFDRIGGWDPEIKSLQDYDFWLRAVHTGSKGLYFKDIFFETEYPHVGGLSFDSANNWIDRMKVIKKKNKIPQRDVCVASLGAAWHARNVAKILGADFQEMPSFKPHEYEAIYVIGWYPQFADLQGKMFMNSEADPSKGLTAAKRIVHFVGSDIYQLQQLSKFQVDFYKHYFHNNVDVVLTEDEFTQKEMADLGIPTQVVPLPPTKEYKPLALPEKFTVACYMPQQNKAFYQPELMVKVANLLPDVSFKFFGDPYERKTVGNIEYMGYLQPNEVESLIKNSSCLMRFPFHDGLSINAVEFMQAGRQVVTNIPVKHTIQCRGDEFAIRNAIIKAQKAGLNKKGSDYWRKTCSHKAFKKAMAKILAYDAKGYWERRAESWDRQTGEHLDNLKELEPIFVELKPKSVIDIGSGNGKWYPYFKKQGCLYRGIDISENLVKRAQERYPDGAFKVCKVEDLPKPKEKFDLAFCFTTLLHVTKEDFPKAVKALNGIAKNLVIVEPSNFDTRHYCHDHNYDSAFNVVKKVKLEDKTIYVCKT